MAEEYSAHPDALQASMAQWQARAAEQIQAWAAEHTALWEYAERRVATGADLRHAITDMREATAWREIEQSPTYQAWEQERAQPIYERTTEEVGEQEEHRFAQEQDPESPWYREDVGSHYTQTREALQAALSENYAAQDELLPHSDAQRLELQSEARELLHALADLDRPGQDPESLWYEPTAAEQRAYEDAPYDRLEDRAHRDDTEPIEIDTSDATMGSRWQEQLAELDARLERLEASAHAHDVQPQVDRTERMSY